ncbi:hypothetical protein JCM5350_000449 [Sporobolomyces pararoseus]
MIPSLPIAIPLDAFLNLDQLPAIEACLKLDFAFKGQGCLLEVSTASSPSSRLLPEFMPSLNIQAGIETRRGWKSNIGDLQSVSKLLNESHPHAAAASGAFRRFCQLLCDGIDSIYTPVVLLAHLARTAATLQLPDHLCSLIISLGSPLPSCGHKECVERHKQSLFWCALRLASIRGTGKDLDDKLVISLNTDLLNYLTNPSKLLMAALPLLSTLLQSQHLSPLRRIPISFWTHFYRSRKTILTTTNSRVSSNTTKKSGLRRSLKRKASTRLLSDVVTASLVSSTPLSATTSRQPSASSALKLLSREKKLKISMD